MTKTNHELSIDDLPVEVSTYDLFRIAAGFPAYEVWGGFEPCALAANHVLGDWERLGRLPESLTLLRTALFFEARRERFVDYGGFTDDPAGFDEHHQYMRQLLQAMREQVATRTPDSEDEAVAAWLESHPPDWPEPEFDAAAEGEWPSLASPSFGDDQVAAGCALAARLIAADLAAGTPVSENRLRARLCLALSHLAPTRIEIERSVPVQGFRGVGPVDILIHDLNGTLVGLIEVKWSVDLKRDKIYEAAWDAVKLVLAEAPAAHRWLITGAPSASWATTETPDLFEDATIDTQEIWTRKLKVKGPNGGVTVGGDCEAGGRGNMFVAAPERIRITRVTDQEVPGHGRAIRASRVVAGEGSMIRFGAPPEFPQRITQEWLERHVPTMPADQYERLLAWLKLKSWSASDLASRVAPHRPAA